MTVFVIVTVLLLFGWRLSKRRRSNRLAGLDSEKPTFAVSPPVRTLLDRKDHRW